MYLRLIMKYLLALFFLLSSGLVVLYVHKPQSRVEFRVVAVKYDTTFENTSWTGSDGYGKHISLRATGILDDSAEIFVKDPTYSERFLLLQLPRGTFDTTWTGEYYEKKADVVYLHKKAAKGNLKIVFRYLTSQGDTLAESVTN